MIWVKPTGGPVVEHADAVTFFTVNDTLHLVSAGSVDGSVYAPGTWLGVTGSEAVVTQWRRAVMAEERLKMDAAYRAGVAAGKNDVRPQEEKEE